MSILETAVETIQAATSPETAFCDFVKAVRQHGYNNATLSLVTDHPSIGQRALHGISTNYPDDWMRFYREKDLHRIDPVYQRVLLRSGPFFWSDEVAALRVRQDRPEAFMRAATEMMHQAEDAGLADGIGLSFVNEFGEIAGIGVSRPTREEDNRWQTLADLSLLSTVFYDRFMSFHDVLKPPSFTAREKDILLWSAHGKSDWEISGILGISIATVRFHWKNTFKKLDVNNRTIATIRAIRQKIVIPDGIGSPIATGK